jgi:hypothetical protein
MRALDVGGGQGLVFALEAASKRLQTGLADAASGVSIRANELLYNLLK